MRRPIFIKFCCLLVSLIITFSITNNTAIADPNLELLNKQTVKIKAGDEIGSGVLLCKNKKGDSLYILTAKHIFESSYDNIRVEFYKEYCNSIDLNQKEIKILRSEKLDIALLSIRIAGMPSCSLEFIKIGNSDALKNGQQVFTTGHVVGENPVSWAYQKGEINTDPSTTEYITHTADISEGYSGGPLVNGQGELIGINTQVAGNYAKAIPINDTRKFLSKNNIPITSQSTQTETSTSYKEDGDFSDDDREPSTRAPSVPKSKHKKEETASGIIESLGRDDDLIAESTYKYWEKCRDLDNYYGPKLDKAFYDLGYIEGASAGLPKSPLTDASVAEQYKKIAGILNEHMRREQSLSTHNVDSELLELFALGRNLHFRLADNFSKKAELLRQIILNRGHISFKISSDMERLHSEREDILDNLDEYDKDCKLLRIKLTQKYHREF